MILIGLFIYLLVALAFGIFIIPRIVSPLGAKYPIAARYVSATAWILYASAASWPVTIEPMLYKVSCSFLTKLVVEPPIDARGNGYLDTRFIIGQYDKNHYDGVPMRSGVEDLVSGRIAFFEAKISGGVNPQSKHSRYLRYSLMDAGSANCKPHRLGYWTGIEAWSPMQDTPTRCLGVEEVETALSQYEISGDAFKGQEGTTSIANRQTDEIVAIFRSFYHSGLLGTGGTYCPSSEGNQPHAIFTKLVFMDVLGNVVDARKQWPKR